MDDTTRQQQQNTIFTPTPSGTMYKAKNVHFTLLQKKLMYYVGVGLCFLSELIHLYLLPQQYEIFFVYGLIFLVIAMSQGVIGASLLFEPGRRLLSFGLWVNALIVVLYIFTHTIGVLVGLAFLPLPIDAWGVGATMAESVVVVILLFLRRDMPRIQRSKERKGTKKRDTETARRNQRKRGVDAPAATGIITRLEQYGLVERRHDREDRCVVKVYLTDEGRDISHTLVSSVEHFEQRMKRGFSESEVDRFLGQLQQLIANASETGVGAGDRFGLLPKDMG